MFLPEHRYSQGGVKFPTGGMWETPRARERLPIGRVSRSGEMPEPTVIVRMKENAERCVPVRRMVSRVMPWVTCRNQKEITL